MSLLGEQKYHPNTQTRSLLTTQQISKQSLQQLQSSSTKKSCLKSSLGWENNAIFTKRLN